jgi:two-component system phosphate regulon response regulator OmpR
MISRVTNRILLVEDDRKLAPLVREFLEDHHFEVSWAADGDQGWRDFDRLEPDLVVLDLMLPGRDGLTLCKEIREAGQVGILILTAKGDESDRIVGLELGADDYLTKPFSLGELLARIRAILRRYRPAASEVSDPVRKIGPFVLDLGSRALSREEEHVDLTRTEFDLFERMTRYPGRVFTREELLDAVRGGETEAFDRAVDRHVSNLRAKIETNPKEPKFILTVWGVGYRWGSS